jgi:protein-tyrosine phosphatase
MIDLHSHCLPNVDDGAKSVEESLKMLSDALGQGVKICAATPHCIVHGQDDVKRFLKKRESAAEALNEAMGSKKEKYPKLILGAEIYLDNDISQFEDVEKLCLGETSYILVEFPTDKYDERCSEWIYSLTLKGLTPLIAHVDRYSFRKKLMDELSGINVFWQINAMRFMSMGGRKIVREILEKTNKCVVSSDMHNTSTRPCNMKNAYEKAQKKFSANAENLFGKNAEIILKSEG